MFTVLRLMFVFAQNIIRGSAEVSENEDDGREETWPASALDNIVF